MDKKLISRIWVDDYYIGFSYATKRGNQKGQTRVVTQIKKEDAERDFWLWININNSDKPYRAMFNVKILNVAKTNGRYINL